MGTSVITGPKGWRKDDFGQWWYYYGEKQLIRSRGIETTCLYCKKPFPTIPTQPREYCSVSCSKNRGGHVDKAGYKLIKRNGKGIPEHRLIMETILGRELLPWPKETVHHINGDRLDNRPENLQLRSGLHGPGSVPCCLDCGSERIGYRELGP